MSKEFGCSILFPFLSVFLIALYGGSLGVLFIILFKAIGVSSVIILGSALVFGVPIVAYLLTRNEPTE